MTTATMALTELAEKGADIDVLRQMVQFMTRLLTHDDCVFPSAPQIAHCLVLFVGYPDRSQLAGSR